MMGNDETSEALRRGGRPAARRPWAGEAAGEAAAAGPAAGETAPGGEFLIVRRPDDPDDPLAGVWGLPAVTLLDGEDERAAAARAGRVKLGVELAVGARIGEKAADRGGYRLRLADYEATVLAGTPAVPQPDASMTQYTACRYTADPGALAEAAARGSLCAQVFLDNSKKRLAAGSPLTKGRLPRGNRRERGPRAGRPGRTAPAEAGGQPGGRRAGGRVPRARSACASLIDVHTHFMPERLLAAVRAYFDAAGPLIGRPWPIVYRQDEQARVAALRAFGVGAFTAMLYPHKPGMARSLNEWAAGFAARTPDCLHTATFFAEPSAAGDVRRALGQGARVFKCHLQVGDFDPNDPLLDEAWGELAAAGVPVVTHCGSGPVAGRYTGPGPVARLLRPPPAAPPGGRAPGHAGVRGVPRPRRAARQPAARHHDGVHAVHRGPV